MTVTDQRLSWLITQRLGGGLISERPETRRPETESAHVPGELGLMARGASRSPRPSPFTASDREAEEFE
jgi:hypothetical protein